MRSNLAVVLWVGFVRDASAFVAGSTCALRRATAAQQQRQAAGSRSNHVPSMNLAQVPFRKYQGLGNDFILVDNRDQDEPVLTARESAHLCDR